MTSDDPTQGATVAETPPARPQDEQAPADDDKAARIASWRASAERIVVQRVSNPGEPDVVYLRERDEWPQIVEIAREIVKAPGVAGVIARTRSGQIGITCANGSARYRHRYYDAALATDLWELVEGTVTERYPAPKEATP